MKPLSISLKLAAWYTAISIGGFAIFGIVMWFILAQSMISWKDRTLQMRANRVKIALAHAPGESPLLLDAHLEEVVGALPEGELIQVVGGDGRRLFPRSRTLPPPALPDGVCHQPLLRDFVLNRERYRQLCQPVSHAGEQMYVVAPSSLVEDRILLRNFTLGLYRTIPLILLVASVGGYLLSRHALRPVDVLIAEARAITPNDLSRRLTVSAPDDQLRRLAVEWNSLLARIDSAMIRVTQFTADASHELRNPIAYIQAAAEYQLGTAHIDSDVREGFQSIHDEAKLAGHLLEDLLLLARLDVPAAHVASQQVDVRAAIQDVVLYFKPLLEKKDLTFCTHGFDRAAPVISINPAHLRRILTALLDNALKYTPAGGCVTLVCETRDGLCLKVKDTGVGIAPRHLDRIFDRFYRVDRVRSELLDGVGLGLPIAKMLTELYGGRIVVESQLGQGAIFSVCFA